MAADLTTASIEERSATPTGVPRVPWRLVLPLAVALAMADVFWVGSLRVAVGAIERSQTPFTSWVRESALSTPLFVLAVLGALTAALHRWGPAPRGRQVVLTGALVAAAASAAGMVVFAASTYYDYLLEVGDEATMGAMRMSCTGPCVAAADTATFWLQLRSLGWGTLLIVGTNLVLVAWALAALGGRLRLGTARTSGTPSLGRPLSAETLLAVGLVGSAYIHAAVVPEHLAEWSTAGWFFVLMTAAELVVAEWVLLGGRASALLAAAAVSAGPLLVWMWSRGTGLPFGPEPGTPEPIGLADLGATLLEAATLVLAVGLLRAATTGARPRPDTLDRVAPNGIRLALVGLLAVTAIGLAGTPLSAFGVLVEESSHAGHTAESS